jgi:hypothetical protein
MVGIPKPFIVCPTRLLYRSIHHCHQTSEHYPASQRWTCQEAGSEESNKALVVLRGQLGDVVEMGDRVDPQKNTIDHATTK